MKKTSVNIMYDDEKLNAVKLYMSQRDLDFKEELEKSVDALYAKYVPANVLVNVTVNLIDQVMV